MNLDFFIGVLLAGVMIVTTFGFWTVSDTPLWMRVFFCFAWAVCTAIQISSIFTSWT